MKSTLLKEIKTFYVCQIATIENKANDRCQTKTLQHSAIANEWRGNEGNDTLK